MVVCGGGALLAGLDQLLAHETLDAGPHRGGPADLRRARHRARARGDRHAEPGAPAHATGESPPIRRQMDRTRPRPHAVCFSLSAPAMLLLAMVSQQPWAAGARGVAKGALAPLRGMLTAAGDRASQVTLWFWRQRAAARGEQRGCRRRTQTSSARSRELQADGLDNAGAAPGPRLRAHAMGMRWSRPRSSAAAPTVSAGPSRSIAARATACEPGMIVVSGAGLVGRVSEAGPHAAIVQTLADPQSRVNAFLSQARRSRARSTGGPDAPADADQPAFGVDSGRWRVGDHQRRRRWLSARPRRRAGGTSVTHRDSATTNQRAG